jgi:hypothetical protein
MNFEVIDNSEQYYGVSQDKDLTTHDNNLRIIEFEFSNIDKEVTNDFSESKKMRELLSIFIILYIFSL